MPTLRTMTEFMITGFGDEIDPEPLIQFAVLNALGIPRVEVRSARGVNVADFTDPTVDALATMVAQAGLEVSAVASPIGKTAVGDESVDETARLRRVATIARALGTNRIRIFSFFTEDADPATVRDTVLRRLHPLVQFAETEGLILLHENEKDIYGDVPERVLDLVESLGSESFRLAWDSANFVQVGVDPAQALPLLLPFIEYLHVKDAVRTSGAVVPAGAGDGALDLVVEGLARRGFSGHASIEPHLTEQHVLGGFTGPAGFGDATRAFRALATSHGIDLV